MRYSIKGLAAHSTGSDATSGCQHERIALDTDTSNWSQTHQVQQIPAASVTEHRIAFTELLVNFMLPTRPTRHTAPTHAKQILLRRNTNTFRIAGFIEQTLQPAGRSPCAGHQRLWPWCCGQQTPPATTTPAATALQGIPVLHNSLQTCSIGTAAFYTGQQPVMIELKAQLGMQPGHYIAHLSTHNISNVDTA